MVCDGVGTMGPVDAMARMFDIDNLVGRGVRIEAGELEPIELGSHARDQVAVERRRIPDPECCRSRCGTSDLGLEPDRVLLAVE